MNIPLKVRIKDWGWRRVLFGTFLRILYRLVGLRLNRVWIGHGRLDLEPPPFDPPEGYDVRMVTREDLMPFARKEYLLDPEFLDVAFGNGDIVTAAFYDGDLVSYTFNTTKRTIVDDQLELLVPDGFRYGYKGWTHPDHRRKYVSRMLWAPRRKYYEENNLNHRGAWYIQLNNYPSRLYTHRHLNMIGIRTGFFGSVRLFGREIPFNSRWARKMGLILVRKGDNNTRLYTD